VFDDSFSALTLQRTPGCGRRSNGDPGAAVIIVGQRVATIADAGKILVLEDGEIVGSGA
jgi:ATP-binding cassette subfamily B protein